MKVKIYILLLTVSMVSCGKLHQCPTENLFPSYIAYADSEIDTIILRRFKTGSNFSQLIDSSALSITNCVFSRQTDTVSLFPKDLKNRISDGYDWQIFNPFDQRTISISDMQFQIEESRSGGVFGMDPSACISPITSYKRDNITVTTPPGFGDNYVFVHK